MKKLIGLLALLMLFVISVKAQNFFDIRLTTQSIDCETNEVCYDVQIKSGNDRLWRYAGQNYRMFYNGALAEFTRVETVLGAPYAPPEVVQDIQHLDLSQEGNLNFDQDLSWLNYFLDMNTAQQAHLLSTDIWVTTSRVCFTTTADVMNDPDLCFEMVWAREELTFNYATAFVEVSEWLEVNSTNDNVHGATYHDLNSLSGDDACFNLVCSQTAPSYDSRITLKSTDTTTNISCYALEIKSSNSRKWPLGDTEFSMFFDGSHASFVNVESILSGSGSLIMGELSENQVITDGPGDLSFEDNLSHFSFTIDQGDENYILSSGEYTEIAEVCLDFSNTMADSTDCFEIVFGREGLTDFYSPLYTNIFTDLDTDSQEAIGIVYQDYNKCNISSCDDLPAPVSHGDINICEGEPVQALSVVQIEGQSVRWYETPSGGVPIELGSTYEPSAAGLFYAEAYDETDYCFSAERTAVALIEAPLPSLTILSKACINDQSSYTLRFSTDATSVEADQGITEKLIGLEWMTSNIPSGADVILTLTNSINTCIRTESIGAPDCECQLVSEPISGGDQVICLGDNIPQLLVSVIQENMTADWYTSIGGSTPLVSDQIEYTPQNITGTGEYNYYVQARSLDNGCVSAMRTLITLSVLEAPVYAFIDTDCSQDLQSYSATIYSDAIMMESDTGDVINEGNGVWRIHSVPANMNIVVSIVSPGGCTISKEITAPSCDCDEVEAPICNRIVNTCEGLDYDEFVAFVPKNHQIRWYDSEVDGTLLAEGPSFKPSLPGKYYAEAMNNITGCISQERAEVELILNAMPDLQIINSVFCNNEFIIWTDIVEDLNNTEGSTGVFPTFRDALNNENALTEPSFLVNEIGVYFFRKTTDAGCYDVEIIIIIPEDCTVDCLADAGTLIPGEASCFDGFLANIIAIEDIAPAIPSGYAFGYLITQGDGKTIIGVNDIPEYIVDAPDTYRIHTIVFDPNNMHIDSIISTIETIEELNSFLFSGGGDICGSIDLDGALFEVQECTDACPAFTLNPEPRDILCYNGDAVTLEIDFNPIDAIIPEGFVQMFMLTTGPDLTIMGIQSDFFEVDASGEYHVHSLVFDPLTLDLGLIDLGVSTAFDVFDLLIDGGGEICASLDLIGALFNVENCIDECIAKSGSTFGGDVTCYNGTPLALTFSASDAVVPDGFVQSFLITQGFTFTVIGLQSEPFEVNAPGTYEVNSFVYDPATFDISIVEFGVTDFFDVYGSLIEGGGTICGSLDFFGTPFDIEICVNELIDLELTKNSNNLNPSEGEEVTFTIEVTNNSDIEATGVAVADRLPDGFTFSDHLSDDGIAVASDGITEILWTDLVIEPQSTERLTFTAIINEIDSSLDYKNVAEVVGADQEDMDSSPNNDDGDQSEDDEDAVIIEVEIAKIDLELIKIANVGTTIAGEEVEYNINLTNRAMTMASGIEVTDQLPDGLDINSITNISNDGVVSGNQIIWNDLSLGFLSSVNLSYTVSVDAVMGDGALTNQAQVTKADQPDVDSTPNNDDGDQSEDDEDAATVQVTSAFIDLSVDKQVNNPTPFPGEVVSFEITVNNNGIIPATGISVADMIPMSGYDLESISNMNPVGQIIGNMLVWSENIIEPTEELVFSFDIIVLPDGDDYKNVTQITSANEQDIDSSPNNDDGDQSEDDEDAAIVTPIQGNELIDLEVSKSVSDLQPSFGDQIFYKVTIVNNGPFDATNVVLRDLTPDGIDALDVTGPNIVEDGEITWTIPKISSGESMSFEYSSIVFESLIENYTNVVQVIAADQTDIDSTPDNDDGDQSEDDEASATIFPFVLSNVDLELTKSYTNRCVDFGDRVVFSIELFNNSDVIATNVSVEDVFSNGLVSIQDISNQGVLNGNNITWSNLSLLPGDIMNLTYSALVSIGGTVYSNTAQIIALDQPDVDSTPDNDDGDQSEDDEDKVTLNPGNFFDLELEKLVDNPFAQPGQRVRFDLTISNVGCMDATDIAVQDILPSGYRAIMNITDAGVRDGNVIVWNNLSISAGGSEVVSFTAEVVHYTINCDYVNVAEIIAANQDDMDSTPNNDDGDQSEDDEDSAEVFPGFMADLELSMTADKTEVTTGDIINYTIKVCNNGPSNARNVQIRDYLPEGVVIVGDLNYKGELNGNQISWSNFTFVAGDCVELFVRVQVLDSESSRSLLNSSEIVLSDQVDPDSSPGNGDVAEDDYAEVSAEHLVPQLASVADPITLSKVEINAALFLEGAFNSLTGQMNTTLNRLGYLPGQDPISFFAELTTSGQPYSGAPWNYQGNEGQVYNSQIEGYLTYPEDMVDWVLISLRTNKTAESTIISRAALLLNDGSVISPADGLPIEIDATEEYYIVVQHRNHLPIMSSEKISVVDNTLSFDFRSNESYTGLLGSGQKDVNGIYCVYAANGDQFSEQLSQYDINVRDIDEWYDKNGLNSAYMNADFDLNGDVNVNDQIMWLYNNGVFSDVPR